MCNKALKDSQGSFFLHKIIFTLGTCKLFFSQKIFRSETRKLFFSQRDSQAFFLWISKNLKKSQKKVVKMYYFLYKKAEIPVYD